jgi:hypothetical protein
MIFFKPYRASFAAKRLGAIWALTLAGAFALATSALATSALAAESRDPARDPARDFSREEARERLRDDLQFVSTFATFGDLFAALQGLGYIDQSECKEIQRVFAVAKIDWRGPLRKPSALSNGKVSWGKASLELVGPRAYKFETGEIIGFTALSASMIDVLRQLGFKAAKEARDRAAGDGRAFARSFLGSGFLPSAGAQQAGGLAPDPTRAAVVIADYAQRRNQARDPSAGGAGMIVAGQIRVLGHTKLTCENEIIYIEQDNDGWAVLPQDAASLSRALAGLNAASRRGAQQPASSSARATADSATAAAGLYATKGSRVIVNPSTLPRVEGPDGMQCTDKNILRVQALIATANKKAEAMLYLPAKTAGVRLAPDPLTGTGQ